MTIFQNVFWFPLLFSSQSVDLSMVHLYIKWELAWSRNRHIWLYHVSTIGLCHQSWNKNIKIKDLWHHLFFSFFSWWLPLPLGGVCLLFRLLVFSHVHSHLNIILLNPQFYLHSKLLNNCIWMIWWQALLKMYQLFIIVSISICFVTLL